MYPLLHNPKSPGSSVHVVFGSECTNSMDYKSIGVFHSFKTSGWQGNITRLLACSHHQKKDYKGWDIGPTFVHPNYYYDVPGYEDSPTYNKPAALMHFTHEVNIEEEFILYIDADMLLRRTMNPTDYGARKGLVVTEYVWYIQEGIENGLAEQFLSDRRAIERAKNTHGGYYHLFHKDDAKKVTPRWLHYTREMRHHPEKYWAGLPGSKLKENIDTAQKGAKYGDVPWISEMYGYAFAAAEVGLDHLFTRGGGGVLYGDDFLSLNHAGPIASHYTLSCQIPSIEHYVPHGKYSDEDRENSYKFDKKNFPDFDATNCNDGFLFPEPPRIPIVDEAAALCAEDAERLNFALCDYYRRNCPRHSRAFQRSLKHCPFSVNGDYDFHFDKVVPAPCGNRVSDELCKERVLAGECRIDPAGMSLHCLKECGFCASIATDDGGPCVDLLGTKACEILKREKECLVNPTYASYNCRKTCGACPGEVERKLMQSKSARFQHDPSDTPEIGLLIAETIGQEIAQMERFVEKDMGQLGKGEFAYVIGLLLMVYIFVVKYGRERVFRLSSWRKSK